MTTQSTRIIRWIAAGASFTACLFAAGCSHLSDLLPGGTVPTAEAPPPVVERIEPEAVPVATAAAPGPAVVAPVAITAPAPRRINVFGEFGQGRASSAPYTGENAFQQHTACDEGYDADVVLDPAGEFIAFGSTRHSQHSDLYLQRVDGTAVIQLTSDPADDAQPAFAPDGKRIAFASTRAGNWDIYLMDTDGKNVQQLTRSLSHEMHPSFSPDGTRLVFCALSPRSDQWELWTLNLQTLERRMVGYGLFPVWSPRKDTDRIAFQRARQRGSRLFSIWTLDLVNGEPRRLTEIAVSSNAAAICPTWSPDGEMLGFSTILMPDDPSATSASPQQDIWLVSADGAARQRLTHGDGTNLAPYWGVDNRIYFISDRGGHENVWSVRAADPPGGGVHASHAGSSPDKSPGQPADHALPALGSADTSEVAH